MSYVPTTLIFQESLFSNFLPPPPAEKGEKKKKHLKKSTQKTLEKEHKNKTEVKVAWFVGLETVNTQIS